MRVYVCMCVRTWKKVNLAIRTKSVCNLQAVKNLHTNLQKSDPRATLPRVDCSDKTNRFLSPPLFFSPLITIPHQHHLQRSV